jgi:hypothetical protein
MKRQTTFRAVLATAIACATACGSSRTAFDDVGLLPSGIPNCRPSAISFAISSGGLRAFEDPTAHPLVARIPVGAVIGLFINPRTGGGCNAAYGPVRSWTSTDPSVADVVPTDEGSDFATLTARRPGATTISADVIYPLQQPPGPGGALYRATHMYYCCPPANCPAAPPMCTYIPIEKVRVVAEQR